MGRQDNNEAWTEETMKAYLKKAAESEEIPESLKPDRMEAWLRENTEKNRREAMDNKKKEENNRRKSYRGWWCGTAAVAACVAAVLFAAGRSIDQDSAFGPKEISKGTKTEDTAIEKVTADRGELKEGTTYQELYQAFSEVWEEQESMELVTDERAMDTGGEESDVPSEGKAGTEAVTEDGAADTAFRENSDEKMYGKTNQQEADVDEADIIKNDGRYLYQVIARNGKFYVQIADTEGGLKEAAEVGSFDNEISNIYVWKDRLVVIENGWVSQGVSEQEQGESGRNFLDTIKEAVTSLFDSEPEEYYRETAYSKIHVYDIKDRTKPQEYHTFTVKGNYRESRISDGYLYFFTQCSACRPRLEQDYRAYVPEVDGEPLSPDKIYLPEETDTASYLVMVSINMEKPDKFTDTAAVVTAADKFYVSPGNIYVTDRNYINYEEQGPKSDSTGIYRFSYRDGKMKKEAEGTVKGTLRDDMAMNEYQGYLRLVTTVESQNVQEIKDDVTGEVLGYDGMDRMTTNSLYVLDEKLDVAGKIENLAKDELVYSARFMGDTGYFVTFRQTDPLFSVDLSDPKQPKVLGELKISGFSEYLHFYREDLLLGIGMEADENTGVTEGLKLSMFDISNPADVKEQSRQNLSDYHYAQALYEYKAVLIDTEKNIFGFQAEGYGEEMKNSYLLYSYEDGAFKEVLSIDCSNSDMYSWRVRGTYIGDCFYLMCANGRIEGYSLTDKNKITELAP